MYLLHHGLPNWDYDPSIGRKITDYHNLNCGSFKMSMFNCVNQFKTKFKSSSPQELVSDRKFCVLQFLLLLFKKTCLNTTVICSV